MENYRPAEIYSAKGDPSKNWYIYFFFNGKMFKKRDGINIRKNKSGKQKMLAAKRLQTVWNILLKQGFDPLQNSLSETHRLRNAPFLDTINAMLEIKKYQIKKRSLNNYRYDLDFFIKWLTVKHIHLLPASEFEPYQAVTFMDHMRRSGIHGHNFNNKRRNISNIFNMMVEREILAKNPFLKTKAVKAASVNNRAYSPHQVEQLNKYMKEHHRHLYYFTRVMYFTFIRVSELRAIRIRDIDFKNRKILVTAPDSKTNSFRYVPINKKLLPVLEEMNLKAYPETYYLFSKAMKPGLTRSTDINNLSRRMSGVLRKLAFEKGYGLYSWKHTGVSAARRAGATLRDIKSMCGHTSERTTEIYLRSLGLEVTEAMAEVDF